MNSIYNETILDVKRATGLQKKKIVLAGNEDTFRKILAMHLAEMGCSVSEAVNSEEALNLFRQEGASDLLIVGIASESHLQK